MQKSSGWRGLFDVMLGVSVILQTESVWVDDSVTVQSEDNVPTSCSSCRVHLIALQNLAIPRLSLRLREKVRSTSHSENKNIVHILVHKIAHWSNISSREEWCCLLVKSAMTLQCRGCKINNLWTAAVRLSATVALQFMLATLHTIFSIPYFHPQHIEAVIL